MKKLTFLLLTFALGCATAKPEIMPTHAPLGVSLLPPEVDIDKLIPPPDDAPILPNDIKTRHKLPIDEGSLQCDEQRKKCEPLPPGILLDDFTYALFIVDKSTARRQRIELSVLKNLRAKEHENILKAEKIYQQAILDLDKENTQLRVPSRWDTLKFYAGFLIGASIATFTAYGTAQAVK